MTCDFLIKSTNFGVVTTTSEDGICAGLVNTGSINSVCFQKEPSNECPVARYTRGEITLLEAQELLKKEVS